MGRTLTLGRLFYNFGIIKDSVSKLLGLDKFLISVNTVILTLHGSDINTDNRYVIPMVLQGIQKIFP